MARVLISMSNDFLNKVDNIASSEQRTRSELIREALRVYIKRNRISNNLKAEENATLLTELLGQLTGDEIIHDVRYYFTFLKSRIKK